MSRKIGRFLIRQANAKRNAAYWNEAAKIYQRALYFVPDRHDVAVQAGNCFKEAGRYDKAIQLYDHATDPNHRAEAMLQKGDALARGGAAADAIDALESAFSLGHPRADARLAEVSQFGLLGASSLIGSADPLNQPLAERYLLNRLTRGQLKDRRWLGTLDRTRHEKAGGPGVFWRDHVAFTQVGWLKLKNKGRNEPLFTGVVAVRARIVSSAPATLATLTLDGRVIGEATPVQVDQHESGRRLSALNIWLDTAALPAGRKSLALSVTDAGGVVQSIRTVVNIVRAPRDLNPVDSDGFVKSAASPPKGDAAAVVAERPAQIRSAKRSLIRQPLRDILVMRVDQLGDLSASLPAIQRLRIRFPRARLTALVAPGLVDIVRASNLCDDVLDLSLAYDHASERRYLEAAEETRVRKSLVDRHFDLAIDLCPGDETRPLLKLVDAEFLVGFNPRDFDYLDFGIDVVSRDKVNRIARLPHSASVMMLVEGLEEALRPERPMVPRLRDDTAALADLGLRARDYVLIHTGARHALNRWPIERYLALADRLIETADIAVVFFSDNPCTPEQLASCRYPDRVLFLQQVAVDLFDALISNAGVMVGNDSGPKHLAAARGVETVSIHVNRLNWNEWGQDSRGVIITKKVPCSGCGLNDIAMCAKDVLCLTSISMDDVFGAVIERWRHVQGRDRATHPLPDEA
jgi:ADP-heptose:LPS heptosyltransferase